MDTTENYALNLGAQAARNLMACGMDRVVIVADEAFS
jgi:hypothetical protein